MKVATKVAIATLSSVLLLGSSVNFAAEAQSYEKTQKTAATKTAQKAPTSEEKKFIESEIKRVRALAEESGDSYVLSLKYKDPLKYVSNKRIHAVGVPSE
ncbi:hypothetical protein [Paenibacillus apiarius]|uniref:hypothetical protein n=1 Tax=Paenibacillus apiarius TaxID=46240 RepID=UPI00197F98CA|nr:hypothetical protein [Paenibacillus apiarius]MBN3526347.1 hypothetical protein [Paenibacillus apiarius]